MQWALLSLSSLFPLLVYCLHINMKKTFSRNFYLTLYYNTHDNNVVSEKCHGIKGSPDTHRETAGEQSVVYIEMGADRLGSEGRALLQADSHRQGNQECKTFSYSCWLDIANACGIIIAPTTQSSSWRCILYHTLAYTPLRSVWNICMSASCKVAI